MGFGWMKRRRRRMAKPQTLEIKDRDKHRISNQVITSQTVTETMEISTLTPKVKTLTTKVKTLTTKVKTITTKVKTLTTKVKTLTIA
jgi:outer membrane murein-binding lipoprotein Lpp